MAIMMIITLRPGWAVKAILVMVIASALLRCVSAATNHSVGGPPGWDLSSNVQAWSASTTFYVGDSLVFTYTPAHDVLEVNQREFTACRSTNPISVHEGGETVVQLTQPGSRFFLCGRRGHCTMGLKFRVDVLPEIENTHNETRGGSRPRRPPSRTPPPPRDIAFPPPLPDVIPKTLGPCANSGVGGMIKMVSWLDYWWVSVATLLLFSISLLLSGFSLFFM